MNATVMELPTIEWGRIRKESVAEFMYLNANWPHGRTFAAHEPILAHVENSS